MITVSIHRPDQESGENTGCAEPDAVDRLRPVLAAAASSDPNDHEACSAVLSVAHLVTVELHARGELPAHLTVAQDDAPVLAIRTIAAAWKHVTRSPQRVPRR